MIHLCRYFRSRAERKRIAKEEDAVYHASWPDYNPSSTNIWATIPPSARRVFEAKLADADREHAAQWNMVFQREAETHRRGERWNWDDYNGLTVAEILSVTRQVPE